MKVLKFLFCLVAVTGFSTNCKAQISTSPGSIFGDTKLLITGAAQADYTYNDKENSFGNIAFKPMFLWHLSDNLFVESELEVATDEGEVEVVLEYLNMVYFINNNLAIHFGRFLPKFGSYRGKYMEAFLNRFPTDPVGFGDGGIGAMTETGLGLQGGANLGEMEINYDFYVSNGPQLLPGSSDAPEEAGQFEYEAYGENNKNKALGGRFGILPLSDASLELGFSFQHAGKTGDSDSSLENVKADMYAIDFNYYRNITALETSLRLIGEWKKLDAGHALYEDFETGSGNYSFNNSSTAFYIQASLRHTGTDEPFLSNLEVSGRYSEFDTPEEALWGGGKKEQTAISLDYWLGWNRVLKIAYQHQTDTPNSLIAQLVFGF